MTPFRESQVVVVLKGTLRGLAPNMIGQGSLFDAFMTVRDDREFWAEMKSLRRFAVAKPSSDAPEAR